jgi:homoserine kinase
MESEKIILHAPGTVANLVCGFDILGLALEEPCDRMEFEWMDRPGVEIVNLDDYDLPVEPERNVAGVVLLTALEKIGAERGIRVSIEKRIKPGSGIGSSAASAAGAAMGAQWLMGNPFTQEELVQLAMQGEKLASGVKHADNIAPCLLGGISLIRSIHPLDIIPLKFPELYVTVVHPQIEVRTADARQILRQQVLLKDAIRQWGNIAGLVTGFLNADYDLIGRSLEDVIIEPIRSILIPGFDEVKKGSRDAGALGGGISGSGPSIFMLSRDKQTADAVAETMSKVYERIGIQYHTYVTRIAQEGVKQVNASISPSQNLAH